MKQKSLIQIWGKAGSGKTTTIKIIRHELEKKYINIHHIYSLPLPAGEIYEIFNCNGFVIGVSSMGDVLVPYLRNHINDCFIQCDIIIAASRVYNDVSNYLSSEAKKYNYRLVKATNYRINDVKSVQDEFSQESAKHIVELIDKIMLGIL